MVHLVSDFILTFSQRLLPSISPLFSISLPCFWVYQERMKRKQWAGILLSCPQCGLNFSWNHSENCLLLLCWEKNHFQGLLPSPSPETRTSPMTNEPFLCSHLGCRCISLDLCFSSFREATHGPLFFLTNQELMTALHTCVTSNFLSLLPLSNFGSDQHCIP